MEIGKKDNLINIATQIKSLNNMKTEYFNQVLFINEIRKKLDNIYDENNKTYSTHKEVEVKRLIETISNQIDEFTTNPQSISNDNYFVNCISNDLTSRIQESL